MIHAPACCRSWGTQSTGWNWCSLPRGHDGPCSCAGTPKPDGALYFEQQPDAIAALDKQRADEAKANVTKAAKRRAL